jgi:dihydroxyacetone kinase
VRGVCAGGAVERKLVAISSFFHTNLHSISHQVRGDVLGRVEAQKVEHDIARVASEAKEVGGRKIAGAALAAVHRAMASESKDLTMQAEAVSKAASGEELSETQ